MNRLLESLRVASLNEGFVLAGVAPAVESTGFPKLVEWVASGYAGSMDYFARRLEAYQHPRHVLESVRSMIVLTYPYDSSPRRQASPNHGRIARYIGGGPDYHDVLHPKLRRLGGIIREAVPQAMVRGVVDTAPLMEREVAIAAGLGWQGKNTLLLHHEQGSYFFLCCLLTSAELPISQPYATSHCGSCTACLDACPTDAFPAPGVMDASRCISYLTIEHRGPIPAALRPQIGEWLFGCDVCQEVCPWNRKPSRRAASADRAMTEDAVEELDLVALFDLDDDQFRDRFRKTPLWRSRRRGLLRNAAIVLGNRGDAQSVVALAKGLSDVEPLVRGAAAWALGRIGTADARRLLEQRLEWETDAEVIAEVIAARDGPPRGSC